MIEFDVVSKSFAGRLAVDRVSLTVQRGELLVLLGASGSGKSTTLRLCNRLLEPDAGMIRLQGQDIRALDAQALRRRMGYAIQAVGLFPHWTVAQNIATVPQLLQWPRQRIAARVDELLNLLQLDPAIFRARYPHQLSGGQQQRVGVARALAAEPEVLLMDEPFGALDPQTRSALQDELARIHQLSGTTILLVTHDVDEALRLADRLVLMEQGRIVQHGRPAELLAAPVDPALLAFLGQEEIGLRRLSLGLVAQRMQPGPSTATCRIGSTASLRAALSLMLAENTEALAVLDEQQMVIGHLRLSDLLEHGR